MVDKRSPSLGHFNGEFLGYTIVTGLLAVFFLLYFNRVVASIVSSVIRTYTWHRYRIYVDIQALQLSLLGGRLFFTGLRYHGNNETIIIQNGHITWSYWLRRVRDAQISSTGPGSKADGDTASNTNDGRQKLPCRINIAVSGLEWFVYNRSAAYDSIFTAMTNTMDGPLPYDNPSNTNRGGIGGGNHDDGHARLSRDDKFADDSARPRQRLRRSMKESDIQKEGGARSRNHDSDEKDSSQPRYPNTPSSISSIAGEDVGEGADTLPLMLQLFPIRFECDTGALVMGNDHTKALLIVKAKSLSGEIDAAECQTVDPYRQLFEINFEHPILQMAEHSGYKEDQLARAVREQQATSESNDANHRSYFRRQRRKALGHLRNLIPQWRKSVESFSVDSRAGITPAEPPIPGLSHWQGLSRYLNADDEDDKSRWSSLDYAAVNTVVDSPAGTLKLHWDVPSKVSRSVKLQSSSVDPNSPDYINGTAPPAWAISLALKGGVINYGPWADRQRAELQRVFFPGLCKDAVAASQLPVGSDRVPTIFNFYLELNDEATLRIPTRESSKNWKWKKEGPNAKQQREVDQPRGQGRGRNRSHAANAAAEQRPYGWLDIKIGANATVSYSMDMLARLAGYRNSLKIDLPSTEVSTSVNHGLLWKSGAQRISCDLSTPLKWNGLRTWRFDVDSDEMELYILREHTFLLIDLIDDWGTGPPSEYLLFTPFKYLLNLTLSNLKVYVNVNDVNIINDPISKDENTYLILSSPCLRVDTRINLDTFRPSKNVVPFKIESDILDLELHAPSWNTQAAFLKAKNIGHLERLVLDANYHYNTATLPSNTDTLVLDITAQSPVFYLYGFLIRYFLLLKDNYFGDHVHFKTLDEYQESLRVDAQGSNAVVADRPPPKKSNDLDVMLTIRADDPRIMLPANLYSARRHIPIEAASLAVDLRFTNYYMDLDLSLSPLSLSMGDDEGGAVSPTSSASKTQLFIDGLTVYGHRLFGLPPTEPTYLCNWDLGIGAITGECSTEFLTALIRGGKAFGFSLDDDENALISPTIVYDVTFLRVCVESVHVWLHVEESAFLCASGRIQVNYNDWARTHYSKRADISIPRLELSCIQSESVARHNSRLQSPVEASLFFRTNLQFTLIGRKYDFANVRQLQQDLVRRHDQRTHRTDFLLMSGSLGDFQPDFVEPAAQSVPTIPQPALSSFLNDKRSTLSLSPSHGSKRLRHKSSFLSFSSSSEVDSILRSSSEAPKGSQSAEHSSAYLGPYRASRSDSKRIVPHRSHSPNQPELSGDRLSSPGRIDPAHRTIAFTSQFFAPYFPLDAARLHVTGGITQNEGYNKKKRDPGPSAFGLEDVDPTQFSQDYSHQSLLFDFPSGINFVLNAASLRCIAALVQSFQPAQPDDLLDSLQTATMSDIFSMQKQENIGGVITDIILRLPHATGRFLNNAFQDDSPPQRQDQYDVLFQDLVFAVRSEDRGKMVTNTALPSGPLPSFHFQLAAVALTASEKLVASSKTQGVAFLEVERVMALMGSKEVNYLDADVGAIHVRSSSGRIEYLASLIHRTNLLLSDTATLFSTLSSVADQRLQYFTHSVAIAGQKAGDPSFVVRPSAVLRAASRHLRTYDSWKLVARLRHMWDSLVPDSQINIMHHCLSDAMKVPKDVRELVVAAFDRWRSWDLEDTSHAVLLDNIFGKPPSEASNLSHVPWMAVGRVHELRFGLDPPSPKSNHVLVLGLTARVSNRHGLGEDQLNELAPCRGQLTVVNVYCRQVGMHVNWELTELVDELLPLYRAAETKPPEENERADQKAPTAEQRSGSLHFVFAMGRGTMSLDTINLTIKPRCENFKLSVVSGSSRPDCMETSVALNCDTAALNVLSHSQELATACLNKPSVIVAYELLSSAGSSSGHATIAVASSQSLDISILQDPIVLAEVADLLIIDEATQLRELQEKSRQPPMLSTKSVTGSPSSFALNIAMFLDSYTITVPLLHSLTYIITGTVSRASIAIDASKHFTLDFDVKENSHDMQVRFANTRKSISLLQIPPMNGRIVSQSMPGERSVELFTSLELVELDVSAVYSLLTALNRPEISNAISDLQQQGKIIQDHLRDLSGPSTSPPPSPKPDDFNLIYNVHTTLAGVKISGNAPIKSNPERSALLSFFLDRIQLQVANKIDQSTILDNPEVHVNIRKIGFEITKGSDEGVRSCGNLTFGAQITASTRELDDGKSLRAFDFTSDGFSANLSSDTVSTFLDVLGHIREKFKRLDTSRELEYLRKLRQPKPRIAINDEMSDTESDIFDSFLASVMYSFQIRNVHIGWLVTASPGQVPMGQEDLFLSVKMIEFATRKQNSARLTIEDLQLQMVPPDRDKFQRSLNSALLPEMIFNVAFISTLDARRLAFQAVGKSLDVRLTSGFIVPAARLKDSITLSIDNVQRASRHWAATVVQETDENQPMKTTVETRRSLFSRKRLESVLLDADFAGAVVHLSGQNPEKEESDPTGSKNTRPALAGKYGQFSANETGSDTALRTPGLAWKAEYRDDGQEVASLHGEIKIEPSRNMLLPSVVPLILDISSSIKEVVSDTPGSPEPALVEKKTPSKPKLNDEESILTADPSAVLGRLRLNLGLRICKQEFTLSCQPIGRVAATARFDDIYVTVNTVHSTDLGNFFALSGTFSRIHLAVQHVYSRESTGSFDVDSIVLSLMNSKHVSGISGLSAIVKMSPMKVAINARQVHDFLLFREIWIPRDIRRSSTVPVGEAMREPTSQAHLVQRYQQVAATAAFPWTATISISALDVVVDLGQSLGKPEFAIKEFWVSSKKTSDWEQNLCLGFERIGINCDGRLSGFVTLHTFQLRTSIEWPERQQALNETPKIQASVSFSEFKLKAAFDYQAFLIADITTMEFLMYNVRQHKGPSGDRLVAIFDGEAVQVFAITASAAQGAALWKAIQKFIQERRANYEASLREIEKYMKRRSATSHTLAEAAPPIHPSTDEKTAKSPISLDTDVVVTLRALNLGVFPSTFSDHQVFKLEALNARARFAANMEKQRIHSILGLTLGQLRIGLAAVRGPETPRVVKDIQVEHVVQNATGSRGGTILKVPKVEAVMETWQEGKSRNIQYKFKSTFEGKVEVGWNYSRISYIRGMWAKHSTLLAQVWGRELPTMSAIKVTGVPEPEQERKDGEQQKITAEVNVPQSKYEYEALEPPVIETPQLRDMGEATPPLEWIGLHRDRLPNLMHQIVIVALLELAGEVEDAYSKILGS
ncbi:putative fermentation associated protein [Rosellinia necatrix]|uniref:Putative fermentation associated protein n=1 Tax=Rosellinia necatrix TaxID=77044 RepID=A0A1W2TTK4_ROSNE|nr:putative fermentation associated protein [Rosellinia necatrix]